MNGLSTFTNRLIRNIKKKEMTTPTFKRLMKRAKVLRIETVRELEDLIADEFEGADPHISGADFEIAKKKLRLE
tara:strand:+ start:1423 stop:1644 length:222 start_codon:yes stop_codon:yes gene_type:complete